ncbi:mycofactocin biosynthesis chaperone MftB [Saccharopolyspora griseoalba]|uniref:Mycofactocin biosynthesis chaperone MftB n=1 Tax=Saccharopolyspora griseoalba TaxID=1431848 RepID=A0ABW2LK24_9PSEU
MSAPVEFDPSVGYRLNPQVALRPEPFGALAYHFGNRKLSFLKVPELVELVRELGEHPSVEEALSGFPEQRRPQFRNALASLAASEMILPKAG